MKNRTTFIIIALIVIGVFGCGGVFLYWELHQYATLPPLSPRLSVQIPTSPLATPPKMSPTATITFAADFVGNGGCEGHKNIGCDIFTATIKFDGTVADVTRLTTNPIAETFPVFSTDKKTIYADVDRDLLHGDEEWITLADKKSGTLIENTRGVAPLPDGKSVAYTPLGSPQPLMMADFATPTSLTNIRQISTTGDYHEPHASSLGDIVFYKLSGEGQGSHTAQGGVYRSSTGEFLDITGEEGFAHCFWGFGGTSAYCNSRAAYPGISRIPFDGGVAGTVVGDIHHPTVASVTALDSDYAECVSVQYGYGSFCDATHLIVTLGCATKVDGVATTTMSKLALVDLSSGKPVYIPLGKNLAESFGGTGASSYTADCRLN